MNLTSIIRYLKPVLVTAAGAVVTGAGSAVAQYFQNGGAPTNYTALATAAGSGAVVALASLYVKPPASQPAAITPIPKVPGTSSQLPK